MSSSTTIRDWLRLAHAGGLHGHRLDALLQRFGSPREIGAAPARALREIGLRPQSIERLAVSGDRAIDAALAWLDRPGQHLLTWRDERYPPLLREISDPPILLFVRGNPDSLLWPQLAIVGSRKASAGARENAWRFAAELARSGFVITSGLARGVDAAAHRGSLSVQGTTIAVCATGPEQIYPPAHAGLAQDIAKQGAVITEYLPGSGPRPHRFPRRNRIISGLATGALVVEAGERSGALITARLAAEQGREVFALPGSIHNPLARGCHRLIRDGAKLVEKARDIVDELGALLGHVAEGIEQNAPRREKPRGGNELEATQKQLLALMNWDPVSIDQLVSRSGLTAAEVSSMLVFLELAGRVEALAGGRFQQREEGNPR